MGKSRDGNKSLDHEYTTDTTQDRAVTTTDVINPAVSVAILNAALAPLFGRPYNQPGYSHLLVISFAENAMIVDIFCYILMIRFNQWIHLEPGIYKVNFL